MPPPSAEPERGLRGLLAALGRPARYAIVAQPENRDQPVTTSVAWACGCRASGPSYRELRLSPCSPHLGVAIVDDDDEDGADLRRRPSA